MSAAVADARKVIKSLHDYFEDWTEARNDDDPESLKDYVGEDLFDLAEDIKGRAERISKDLAQVAETYDGIIDDATKTTKQSEEALANRLKDKKEIQKEIDRNNAERKKLESLVEELKADMEKYQKEANEYKSSAETAERRAFIMSIFQVYTGMVSSAIPVIAAGITASFTGGLSLVGAAASMTARQVTNAATATTESDNTAKEIETKFEIAQKKSDKFTTESEISKLEKNAKVLAAEKSKVESDEGIDPEAKATQLEAIGERIKENETEINNKKEKILALTTALSAFSESLDSLGNNMGQMSDKREDRANNLRDLQMRMLDKAEKIQTAKRDQASDLVRINALLTGQRTEEETIQLAIQSLNLSLKALKRMREIIFEISFFFKSFADFMQLVMNDSAEQSKLIENALERDRLTKSFPQRIKRNTDDFFITQAAQWEAAEVVSVKFVDNFKDGWSKLNRLSGNYLTGDELKSYLKEAAAEIEDISFKRKEAAEAENQEL
jgi:hypothetical protein